MMIADKERVQCLLYVKVDSIRFNIACFEIAK